MILLRVGHKNFVIEIADAERCIPSRRIWIDEAVGSHLMKILIVGFNLAGVKIRHEQKIVTASNAERCAFVNSAVDTAVGAVINSAVYKGATLGVAGGHNFLDRKSTRLNYSHVSISYAVFFLK